MNNRHTFYEIFTWNVLLNKYFSVTGFEMLRNVTWVPTIWPWCFLCLFQTKGQTSEEVNVIEDLINNYVEIFEVNILYPALVKIVFDVIVCKQKYVF